MWLPNEVYKLRCAINRDYVTRFYNKTKLVCATNTYTATKSLVSFLHRMLLNFGIALTLPSCWLIHPPQAPVLFCCLPGCWETQHSDATVYGKPLGHYKLNILDNKEA